MDSHQKQSLIYHSEGRPGKVRITPTKPCVTQRDLSLAYTPGVAGPCLEIAKEVGKVFEYTNKGNLVAVVSNGTAVLGLGDIGPEAGKPVMEGKGVLFSRFAGIDVFDIEVATHDPEEMIRVCELIAPTFGGINLEDIKAPECFEIEERLIESLDIPVFHDDQHGTAIISAAGLLNALELVDKKIDEIRVVFNGAGAAGIACCVHFQRVGVKPENIILCDSRGVIYKGREAGMNKYKERFAAETDRRTLADAMQGADVFCGVSVRDVVTPEMLQSMADKPIVFALANPDPEITYEKAIAARPDIIMATGRSDFPNQVNNVLGFPFIFRGALDVRARKITPKMMIAATQALAQLAKEEVPEVVVKAYEGLPLNFGPKYIIPKPFDPRALFWVASAVARAAMDDGVAREPIQDWEAYRITLEKFNDPTRWLVAENLRRVKQGQIPTIVFPDGDSERVLHACSELAREGICRPIILGEPKRVRGVAKRIDTSLEGCEIIPPWEVESEGYAQQLFELRQRKGLTVQDARVMLRDPNALAAAMVRFGGADSLVSGAMHAYPWTVRPAIEIIGLAEGFKTCCGVHVMSWESRTLLFADTAINPEPTIEMLADYAVLATNLAHILHIDPKIAFLSLSNFGSYRKGACSEVAKVPALVRPRLPGVPIDGEMQVGTAVTPSIAREWFPFSEIQGDASILIFPTLCSGNIAYKLCRELGGARAIGPILMGLKRPVNVIHRTATVEEIIDVTAITARRWQLWRYHEEQQAQA